MRLIALLLVLGCGGARSEPTAPPVGNTADDVGDGHSWARFRDGIGLSAGARVVYAGLPIGTVLRVVPDTDSVKVKVVLSLDADTELWTNATLTMHPTSKLGEMYLELDPGDPSAAGVRRLAPGEEIVRVIDLSTPEGIRQRIDETLPDVTP
jgi:phospholipid/cholesterol/gamma-HCH transport system substrate-binding protein